MPRMENLGFEWAGVRRIGVLGGTFDPIHYGHLVAAEAVSAQLDLDRVVLVPAGQPPHKTGRQISPAHHRHVMCLVAAAPQRDWAVSRVELSRPGRSYTVETLRQLREWTGPDCELVFIVGADMALDLPNWCRPDAILDQARFVAVHRPGYDLRALDGVLGPARASRVERVVIETPDVSGTEIRRRVGAGQSIMGLAPPGVCAYISAAGLYLNTKLSAHIAAKRDNT